MSQNGSDILVLLDVGTEATPVYQVVGCQRDATFEETSETIDFSSKESRAQRVDSGRYSSSISLDFLYVENRSDYLALRDANRNGDLIVLARYEDGVITQRVTAKIDSMSESFPDQGESIVSAAFLADGEVVSSWIIGIGIIGDVFIA